MRISFIRRFGKFPYLLRLLFIIFGILLIFGMIIHFLEPDQFPTIFDGVWWAIITTSTIGYGDYVPVTFGGRIVGIILVLIGVGFVSTYFVALATLTVKKQNGIKKGTKNVNVKDHIVVIGWNERSREMIYGLNQVQPERSIILIDSTLEESPFATEKNLFFLKGQAFSEAVLKKANLKEAYMVLLTSDASKKEMEADMQTILTVVAIKGYAPAIYCVAEILTGEQIINAKRAGADEIIPSNKLSSSIMLQTMMTHGISDPLMDFVNTLNGVKVKFLTEHSLTGQNFEAASSVLLKDNLILIGVNHKGKVMMGPSKELKIDAADQLLVIAKE